MPGERRMFIGGERVRTRSVNINDGTNYWESLKTIVVSLGE